MGELLTMAEMFDAYPDLRTNGDWVCIAVETSAPWPTKPQDFYFDGHRVWVIPHLRDAYGGLALNSRHSLPRDDGWALLHRALSVIAWHEDAGATVAYMTGGNLPRMMGRRSTQGIITQESFDLIDLQEVASPKIGLALALMREGRGLNHPAYAFLTFFRVLEICFKDGKERGYWMDGALSRLRDHRAKGALAELGATVSDIGEHLYQSGRNAVAHARGNRIINPDDPRDTQRMRSELPIMAELAKMAVEEILEYKTSSTIYTEHLYELRGWRTALEPELIRFVLEGGPPPNGKMFGVPRINFRLRRSKPFPPLEGLEPFEMDVADGQLALTYRSVSTRVYIQFRLDFSTERIDFDIHNGVFLEDDGSASAALEHKYMHQFFAEYVGNGEIQIFNHETGALLSRKDAFIPVNYFLNHEAAQATVKSWEQEAERRSLEGR